jgi:hypothetical protein
MLGERGVVLEMIRASPATSTSARPKINADVTDQRKAEGIAALERTTHSLAA